MYPFRRQILESLRAARLPPLQPGEAHRHRFRVMPWDIDPFGDFNNGRIVTLTDIGRIALAQRMGLIAAMRRRRWGLAMAGSAPQYRRRVTVWERCETVTRLVARDARFVYIDHVLLAGGEPAAQVMCRTVLTEGRRLLPTQVVCDELGAPDWNPPKPAWVEAWIAAEALRPWPPVLAS